MSQDTAANAIYNSSMYYGEESEAGKLARKTKEAPYMPIGIGAALGGVLYGIYKYKNRGGMSTSLYLIQMRVAAQSAVVGALTCGVLYTIFRDHVFKKEQPQKEL
jgi:hypothetical protein